MTSPPLASATAPESGRLHDVVSRSPRPSRPRGVSASLTFATRALLKIKHVPEQMADAIMIPILFTVLFTYLFGGALAGSTDEYLQFLLPGTMVFAVLLITVYAGVNLNSDITKGVLDRYRSMPIWRPSLIVGSLISDAGRNILAAGLVIALGLVMGSALRAVRWAFWPLLACSSCSRSDCRGCGRHLAWCCARLRP